MNKSQLKDRLRLAMQGPPKVSQAELARAIGVSPPSVNDWLSGKTVALKGENLKRAARKLGVNAGWLGLGEGPMHGSAAAPTAAGTVDAPPVPDIRLNPTWIAEVACAMRTHAEANGKQFDIESPEGSDDFAHWYGVRTLLSDVSTLDNVIELESRRTQKGTSPSGHESRAATRGAYGKKR